MAAPLNPPKWGDFEASGNKSITAPPSPIWGKVGMGAEFKGFNFKIHPHLFIIQ